MVNVVVLHSAASHAIRALAARPAEPQCRQMGGAPWPFQCSQRPLRACWLRPELIRSLPAVDLLPRFFAGTCENRPQSTGEHARCPLPRPWVSPSLSVRNPAGHLTLSTSIRLSSV